MNIYKHLNYRRMIKDLLLSKKKSFGAATYSYQKLATHCRIHRAYLSSVIAERSHLNSDQLFLAADFFKISNEEREYLDLVMNYERTASEVRRKYLKAQIDFIRQQQLQTKSYIKMKESPIPPSSNEIEDSFQVYFQKPILQIIHLYLTIPRYAAHPQDLKSVLGVGEKALSQHFLELERLGLIAAGSTGFKVLRQDLHLPPNSPMFDSYRNNLRLFSMSHLTNSVSDSKYSFSVLFSCTEETRMEIQSDFLELLKKAQVLVEQSPARKVCQMNFDIFSYP